jgi:hypothetical protein
MTCHKPLPKAHGADGRFTSTELRIVCSQGVAAADARSVRRMPERFFLNRIWVLTLVGLIACDSPETKAVRADFTAARPGAEVLGIVPTEGDAEHVYYRIRFRDTVHARIGEEEWGYRRASSGRWELFTRDSTR